MMKNLLIVGKKNKKLDKIARKIRQESGGFALVEGDLDNQEFLDYLSKNPTISYITLSNIENRTLQFIENIINNYNVQIVFVIEEDDKELKTYFSNITNHINTFGYINNKYGKGFGRFIGECKKVIYE